MALSKSLSTNNSEGTLSNSNSFNNLFCSVLRFICHFLYIPNLYAYIKELYKFSEIYHSSNQLLGINVFLMFVGGRVGGGSFLTKCDD